MGAFALISIVLAHPFHIHSPATPRFRTEMALVNEPTTGAPTATALGFVYGRCRDRYGDLGVAYHATRRVGPGEQVTTCYGPSYHRAYRSDVCSRSPKPWPRAARQKRERCHNPSGARVDAFVAWYKQ